MKKGIIGIGLLAIAMSLGVIGFNNSNVVAEKADAVGLNSYSYKIKVNDSQTPSNIEYDSTRKVYYGFEKLGLKNTFTIEKNSTDAPDLVIPNTFTIGGRKVIEYDAVAQNYKCLVYASYEFYVDPADYSLSIRFQDEIKLFFESDTLTTYYLSDSKDTFVNFPSEGVQFATFEHPYYRNGVAVPLKYAILSLEESENGYGSAKISVSDGTYTSAPMKCDEDVLYVYKDGTLTSDNDAQAAAFFLNMFFSMFRDADGSLCWIINDNESFGYVMNIVNGLGENTLELLKDVEDINEYKVIDAINYFKACAALYSQTGSKKAFTNKNETNYMIYLVAVTTLLVPAGITLLVLRKKSKKQINK